MINLINFILTKYMGVLKKIYIFIFISYSFNTIISANEDETEFIDDEDVIDDGYDETNNDDKDIVDDEYDETDNDDEDVIDDEYDETDNDDEDIVDDEYDETDIDDEDVIDDEYDETDNNDGDVIDDEYDETYHNNGDIIDNEYINNYKNNNYDKINTKDNRKVNGNNLDEEDIDEKIAMMKERIEKREEKAKKKFFESYNRLHRDVQILKARDPYRGKKDGLADIDAQYRKFRIINVGLYGYTDLARFIRYTIGNSNPKISRLEKKPVTPKPGEVPKNVYRAYLLSSGLCININIGSGGLSILGGYCVMEDRYIWDTVDTYVGINIDLLFRFPVVQLLDFALNIIDPIGILLYFTGLRRRTEWYVGLSCCFYESKDIGKFDIGFKNSLFKDIKALKDDTSKSVIQKATEVLFKHCTIGRRVYVNQHVFYSFTSTLLFPVLLICLNKDCKQVGKFFKDWKFVDSILNISLGILI